MTTVLWRVVVTDSETLDGIAPVCPEQMRPGGLHHHQTTRPRGLRTNPRGFAGFSLFAPEVRFDRYGIYDCCPRPHLWAPDAHVAAELADMMSACGVQAG